MRNDPSLRVMGSVGKWVNEKIAKGTKEFPARTCKDLFKNNPTFTDGQYWIDPNEADIDDAIFVNCTVKDKATCVQPGQEGYNKGRYSPTSATPNYGRNTYELFSNLRDGAEFTYKADGSQMNMLRYLHAEATQFVVLHCNRDAIGVTDHSGTKNHAIKLIGHDDREITHDGPTRSSRYTVNRDHCRFNPRRNTWATTKVSVTTKTDRLPLQDISIYQPDNNRMEFGIYVGQVCFRG